MWRCGLVPGAGGSDRVDEMNAVETRSEREVPVAPLPPRPVMAVNTAATSSPPAAQETGGEITIEDLSVYYGGFRAVRDVSLTIPPRAVTAIIGPSGCGKSTFLRTLNRMHELTPGARVDGAITLDGIDIYRPDV